MSANKLKNPFQSIYEACTTTMEAKQKKFLPFPLMLDIELTNRCNMRCAMCPTGMGAVKRQSGNMDFYLLRTILNEAAKYHAAIRFIRWGEPTLYPRLVDAVKECKKRNLLVHINTNGLKMSSLLFMDLMDAGLDSIKFSMQGVNPQGYLEYRRCNEFSELLGKVNLCHELRLQYRTRNPFIQIGTTITTESEEEVSQFKRTVDAYTDAVYIGKTRDLSVVNDRRSACQCPEVWTKLSVNWDGRVSACCGDYDNLMPAGHLRDNKLSEIWFGETMENYRKMLSNYEHYKLPLCSRCARSIEV